MNIPISCLVIHVVFPINVTPLVEIMYFVLDCIIIYMESKYVGDIYSGKIHMSVWVQCCSCKFIPKST